MYETALANLAPHKAMRSLQWFIENTATHEGKPYRDGQYPHLGAPGGPCDMLDDRSILVIWLQWASRLGKTFFGRVRTNEKGLGGVGFVRSPDTPKSDNPSPRCAVPFTRRRLHTPCRTGRLCRNTPVAVQ